MALARARALKMCSGGVMTETRLDVLLLSPHLRPQASKLYLREMNAFYCSRIHYFRGKNWQLRSVKDKNGRFSSRRSSSILEVAPTIGPYSATCSSNVSSQVLTVLFGVRSTAGASSTSQHPWEMISTCSRKDGMM